jgi:hypothetical protein
MTPVMRIRTGGDPGSAPEKRGAGKESAISDFRAFEGAPIKFGSFSLGDVFERERDQKTGTFCFS